MFLTDNITDIFSKIHSLYILFYFQFQKASGITLTHSSEVTDHTFPVVESENIFDRNSLTPTSPPQVKIFPPFFGKEHGDYNNKMSKFSRRSAGNELVFKQQSM